MKMMDNGQVILLHRTVTLLEAILKATQETNRLLAEAATPPRADRRWGE